uniref:ATPase AAA-type core domain-containing protein n=1 Tax=Acrobeloides nanus TaxID=290746 RepID=A0A914DC60_9BILA
MNLVENDCYDFWSLDGRVPDKAISESIEKAKKYAPCLCVFDGIAILDEDSQARIESGNRTLELLRNSIQTLPPNVIVIFTCQTVELPNLPVTIAEMVHFEYIIENLTEEDRKEFAKFMLKRFKVNEEIGLTWFANNTRGFVLAELNQLVDTAKANASAHGESTIRKQDIQFGIDKRNKAFGDIVGVPKDGHCISYNILANNKFDDWELFIQDDDDEN